ncbi:hypothetical protein GQ42DRAFT_74550 [Ramicandelaber brevisporus]|nr:hypothetical protein GQ42DRAFT_74550 [Ramicandelaber brevisporus]
MVQPTLTTLITLEQTTQHSTQFHALTRSVLLLFAQLSLRRTTAARSHSFPANECVLNKSELKCVVITHKVVLPSHSLCV